MKQQDLQEIRDALKKIFTRRRVIVLSITTAAFLVITPIVTYAHFARDISDPERLMNRNSTGIILKDKNGEIFYEYGHVNDNDHTKLAQVSDDFEHALLASEDQEFYKHEGYSLKGIVVALYADVSSKDPTRYGGSTITQQLVKNKLFSSNKNFLRKYQELSMAVAVERRYSKDEILEMYINSVYFGEGAFGVTDAAKTYFNKTPQQLTAAESSMLVGLLPAPSVYSPISGDKAMAKQQQKRVLQQMVEAGYLNSHAQAQAFKQPLTFAEATEAKNFSHAQHYTMMVLDELKSKYGEERMIRSGFEVNTGLDMKWQKQAEENIKKNISKFQAAGGRNSGLVAIDPKTGEIRALVGSVNWDDPTFGKVNMALSPRQPGSSFKPIYYSEALDKHLITPATILQDEPKDFGGWKPENYDFKYRGNIAVRNALAQSLNIPAAEVMQKLGVDTASAAAQQIGVTTVNEPAKYGLTLALGTAEAKLYDMTNAYAALANKGELSPPVLVTHIEDKYGQTVLDAPEHKTTKARSQEASFLISSILSDNAARAPTFGSSLNIPNHQVAVKTGTTNDNKDAWTIGYTPSISIGVWVGNNENQPMHGLAGGSSAGVIWKETMSSYLKDLPTENFEMPTGVAQIRVCKGSGLRATNDSGNTYIEYFIKGTEPTASCNDTSPPQPQIKDEKKKEEVPAETIPQEDKPKDRGNEDQGQGNNGRGVGGRGGESPDTTDEIQPVTPTTTDTPPGDGSGDTPRRRGPQ